MSRDWEAGNAAQLCSLILIVFEKYVWNKEITDIPFKTSQFSYKLFSKLFLWNLEIRPKAWEFKMINGKNSFFMQAMSHPV